MKNKNNCQKNLKNSRKTLKMDKHFLKDIHILKLNILGCDMGHMTWHVVSALDVGVGPTRMSGPLRGRVCDTRSNLDVAQ